MSATVDLNADMGESFGAWSMGRDAELLEVVTSANVACGFHAGDPDVMARTFAEAARQGVAVGAHPGFADLQGFGRRRIDVPPATLANQIRYQVAAAAGMARAAGLDLAHVKLHGALSNMAAEDIDLARLCIRAARDVVPGLRPLVQAATAMEIAARELGEPYSAEIFADRAYEADGTLRDRRLPGAVIHDPAEAARRVCAMLAAGAILAEDGSVLPARIDTVCVHGDGPAALEIARAVRAALLDAGCVLRAPGRV